jgi:hypothetical protein
LADPTAHVDDLGQFLTNKSNDRSSRLLVAASLGTTRSQHAAPYLRSALRNADTPDPACALLIALGRVIGSDATEDIAPFLDIRSVNVRGYAFHVEGFVGDLRVMDRMLAEWSKITKAAKGRQSMWSLDVIRYLGRHFGHFDHEQQVSIVRGGHRVWLGLHRPPWLKERWPATTRNAPRDRRPGPLLLTETLEDLYGKRPRPSG